MAVAAPGCWGSLFGAVPGGPSSPDTEVARPLSIASWLVLLQAAAAALPPPVQAGLDELESGRCDAAFVHWSRPAGIPGAGTGAVQRLTDCAALRRLGTLHGHELLRVVPVGERIRRVYLVLRYQAQPVYLLVVAYRPADEWIVIKANWNLAADRVLPPDMVPPEQAARP